MARVRRPTPQERRERLWHFEELVRSSAPEAAFQALFARCPYILSDTLPLRLDPTDIRPLGRPGRSEPDFIIYPQESPRLSSYGVIELKRPDSRIFRDRRRRVLSLSADAQLALDQARHYLEDLEAGRLGDAGYPFAPPESTALVLGNNSHCFVIMGLSDEVLHRVRDEVYGAQLSRLVPPSYSLIPYDALLKAFSATVAPRIFVLTPDIPTHDLLSLVRTVEAALRDPELLQGSQGAFDFWEAVDVRLRDHVRLLGDARFSRQPAIRRERFAISGTRYVALESDGYYEFHGCIATLMRELGAFAGACGIPHDLDMLWANASAFMYTAPRDFSLLKA